MRTFSEKESFCAQTFRNLGDCYHLWTPENFEIIFTCDDDFKVGMGIMAVAAALFPDVIILTFELMTNHLHITAAGDEVRLKEMFQCIKTMLQRFTRSKGRTLNWKYFEAKTRKITDLNDLRTVIVYNNHNGHVISPDHTPFSYPWGANRYYFNPDAWELARLYARPMTVKEIRAVSHSRMADKVTGLRYSEGCALPTSFCDIRTGESLFRDASHYFFKVSKAVEATKEIAREIGESSFYTDDELYAAIASVCKRQFNESVPSQLTPQQKMDVARIMKYEYNASSKQIRRILKLSQDVIAALGF